MKSTKGNQTACSCLYFNRYEYLFTKNTTVNHSTSYFYKIKQILFLKGTKKMNNLNQISKESLCKLNQKAINIGNQLATKSESYDDLLEQCILLYQFFNDFLTLSPILVAMIETAVKIQDSEVFRNKIINKEIESLKKTLKEYEVKELNDNSTEIELLRYHFYNIINFRIKVLNKLKETYSKNEDTLIIKF